MGPQLKRDPDQEWLDHVQPIGLVVAPVLLKELGLVPARQTQADTAAVAHLLNDDTEEPALRDPWAFVHQVLGWEAAHVAGSPGGPPVPEGLHVRLPEQDTTLSPTWAVRELGGDGRAWQLLVRVEATGVDPDARGALEGWEASPHQRFERLLRESGVFAGLLISEKNERNNGKDRYLPELRLVYAPRGETSGYLSFPLRELTRVVGRPMLGGLKLLLDSFRLFADADDRRLPALLKQSRDAQATVSTALAEQVLGALHDLLRGLDAAEPNLVRELAGTRPGHLYEGLLTVLMRLVFILYAEDRDLLPSRTDGRAREIYETSYAVRGLYAKLVEDAALNPDTMDERRGAWGRLLALFRLIHKGHATHFVQARGGKLFDPDQFLFLEGRGAAHAPPRVLPMSDGCLLRVLEGLMTLKGKAGRERLSYRALDVEQIGSVYEIVMGFTVETTGGLSLAIKAGKNNHTPVFVDLEKLAAAQGKDRIRFLKEEADRGLSGNVAKAVEAARSVADLSNALDPIVDERASPRKHETASGTPILQPTDERRRTGSHYTPRSLTEPIVRYALEPAFDRLGAQATPEQILDLKVCDPAMGSGAFLVETCRTIAAKLVEAWGVHKDKKPAIPQDEDEDLHARRLVAQRCLYGVDKNPLATDLAKLSLWLATLARDHEFTFLDHSLKSGDSLVGLTQTQIAAAHWDTSKPGLPLFRQLVRDRVAEAMKGRAEIQAAPDDTARAIQEARHRSLEVRLKDIRLMGDAIIAAFFAAGKQRAREKERTEVESWLTGSLEAAWDKLAHIVATLKQGAHPLTPFHWEIEFPEVFARENGGFDAVVGNPPFAGMVTTSKSNRDGYIDWLQTLHEAAHGNADLVAHFFRRAFNLLRHDGVFGLIATNTIRQGDTRETGLRAIIASGGTIFRAHRRLEWPGEAAVVVCVVHVIKGNASQMFIDTRSADRISAYLVDGEFDLSPERLTANSKKAFKGSVVLGIGFTFDDEAAAKGKALSLADMERLVQANPQNMGRIFPYIGGEEFSNDPRHLHRRYVIDFATEPLKREECGQKWCEMNGHDRLACIRRGIVPLDYSDPVAADWPDLLAIVERLVKPQRNKENRPARRIRWWRFGDRQPGLYSAIAALPRVLAITQTSPHLGASWLSSHQVFDQKLVVLATASDASLCLVQSRMHEIWARFFASTMKDDLSYTPSDCFQTFPFPPVFETEASLESAGSAYHDHRAALMVARNEGMTKTYNRFHDRSETAEDIERLRELHAALDRAVLEAYGWHDLAERAAPIFLDETNEDDHTYQGRLFWPSAFRDEILARLLALNAERHAEEVRLGIAPGQGKHGRANDEGAMNDDILGDGST